MKRKRHSEEEEVVSVLMDKDHYQDFVRCLLNSEADKGFMHYKVVVEKVQVDNDGYEHFEYRVKAYYIEDF